MIRAQGRTPEEFDWYAMWGYANLALALSWDPLPSRRYWLWKKEHEIRIYQHLGRPLPAQ